MPQGDFALIASDSLANSGAIETRQRKAKSSIAGSPESLALYEKKSKDHLPRITPKENQTSGNIKKHEWTEGRFLAVWAYFFSSPKDP